MGAETFIRDGANFYICETCGSHNPVQMGRSECSECGAWYITEVVQEVRGTEPQEEPADYLGGGPGAFKEKNPSAEELFNNG